ncbi:hypothetical protein AA0115_g9697 [Alternaria tenuissima]|uniref:D-lactate dehydratase n=1 Tax=Alternaria tenuissima TaxID=119927 RepID=A0AB37W768_9PLEO|nr:hypothetical protein AA0115_g9697 [Alternaria tenuissima]
MAVLTRAGFEVKSAGVSLKNKSYAHLSRNIRIAPDYPELSSVSEDAHERYDVLILPGGAPGAKTFCGDNTVLDLINEFRKRATWVAAICAATTALVAAHKRDDGTEEVTTTVTSHPSVKDEVVQAGWQYSEDRVVVDQNIITSRGPGTAILFALTIVEELCGKEKRDDVAGPMIVAETL